MKVLQGLFYILEYPRVDLFATGKNKKSECILLNVSQSNSFVSRCDDRKGFLGNAFPATELVRRVFQTVRRDQATLFFIAAMGPNRP